MPWVEKAGKPSKAGRCFKPALALSKIYLHLSAWPSLRFYHLVLVFMYIWAPYVCKYVGNPYGSLWNI